MPTIQWMTSIPVAESDCLHSLVRAANIELSIKNDLVWLRGEAESEEALLEIDHRLRAIPGAERFRVVDTNLLQPIERLLPTRACPDGPWQSAASVLSVEIPPSSLSGAQPNVVAFEIVRGATSEANATLAPSILECDFTDWSQWALQASEARLGGLAFACDASGRTIVRGFPLPPFAGKRWIEYGNVAVAVGHSWQPAVSVKTLNRVLNATTETIHFLEEDRQRVLDHSSFVMATRSSIRATADSLAVRCD